MSVQHKWKRRTSADGHPSDLELTIVIVGAHDIYRFAHLLLRGQVEFGELGRNIIKALGRRMRPGQWSYMDRSLGGWRQRYENESAEEAPR